MFPYWVKKLFPKKSRPAPRSRRPNRTRLGLEQLESRLVPAVSVNLLAGGTLQVVSDSTGHPITLDHSGQNTLVQTDTQSLSFPDSQVTETTVVSGGGTDTVAIRATAKQTVLLVTGTVNVGNGGSLQGIQAVVDVRPAGSLALTVDDSTDLSPHNATIDTVSQFPFTTGRLTGVITPTIFWRNTANTTVNLEFGPGTSTVNVLSTRRTTTNVFNNGRATVNVGSAPLGSPGSLTGIQGPLNLENEPDFDTVNLNNSADAARTATLDSVARAGDSSLGRLNGLSATITWDYADTTAVNLAFSADNTVNVLATGVTTNLFNAGHATVNVGNAGSLAGIQGFLNLENEQGIDNVTIDDSADPAPRTAAIDTVARPGDTVLGQLSGLSAVITWDTLDTGVLQLHFGPGTGTVNVLATGPTTGTGPTVTVFNTGPATVNVGSGNSLAGITGGLLLENEAGPEDTVNLNDSADAATRFPAVLTTTRAGGETSLGTLGGLSFPVSWDYADTAAVNITFGPGTGTVAVEGTGVPTNLFTTAAATVNVGNNANTLDDIQGPLTVTGAAGALTTLNINDQGSTTPHTYTQTATTFSRSGAATITFFNITTLSPHKGPVAGSASQAQDLALTDVIQAGELATLSGQLVTDNPDAQLTLTVDWGDGSDPDVVEPGLGPFSLQHSYDTPGTYTVRGIWTDLATGESNSRDLTIVVLDA
jgi:hypothetical protein